MIGISLESDEAGQCLRRRMKITGQVDRFHTNSYQPSASMSMSARSRWLGRFISSFRSRAACIGVLGKGFTRMPSSQRTSSTSCSGPNSSPHFRGDAQPSARFDSRHNARHQWSLPRFPCIGTHYSRRASGRQGSMADPNPTPNRAASPDSLRVSRERSSKCWRVSSLIDRSSRG